MVGAFPMNEKDVLAIADNFARGIKNKKIFNIYSESKETKAYAVLEIKVLFKGGSNGKQSYNRN